MAFLAVIWRGPSAPQAPLLTKPVSTTNIHSARWRDEFTYATVLSGLSGLWKRSGILSCSSSTLARSQMRLPCGNASSSLHRELPQVVVIHLLECEPNGK